MNSKIANLIAYLKSHNVQATETQDGNIAVIEVYTLNGIPGQQVVTLEPNYSVIRDWLGY